MSQSCKLFSFHQKDLFLHRQTISSFCSAYLSIKLIGRWFFLPHCGKKLKIKHSKHFPTCSCRFLYPDYLFQCTRSVEAFSNKIESQSKSTSKLFQNKIMNISRPCLSNPWFLLFKTMLKLNYCS